MRVYVLGAVLLGVCVWGYLQTKKLSDSGIEDFYQADAEVTGKHDADAQCAMLADDFKGSAVTTINGRTEADRSISKTDYCDRTRKFFGQLERFNQIVGRDMPVEYHTNSGAPVYSADHRSATVQVEYEYSLLEGKLLHVTGTRQDTVVKRNGKVLLLAAEDRSTGTMGIR